MPRPHGFTFETHRDGTVHVTHHGRPATALRGRHAEAFLTEVTAGDAQRVMARWTGNHRRGNERRARDHPRTRR
ncbi:hypothetical protein SGLAM104S_01327 [Streptomyces glaucescens]